MARVVINIPDEIYNRVQNAQICDMFGKYSSDIVNTFICIQNGTVLPKGKWIRTPNEHRVDICCTNCGYRGGYSCFFFCPNCGADMRGEYDKQ